MSRERKYRTAGTSVWRFFVRVPHSGACGSFLVEASLSGPVGEWFHCELRVVKLLASGFACVFAWCWVVRVLELSILGCCRWAVLARASFCEMFDELAN